MTSEWPLVPLGELVEFKTGKLDSNAAVDNGTYPFFTCSPTTLAIDKYAFDTEAVLLAGNNANGIFPVKYYQGKFNAYQRTYVVTPKDRNRLSTKWLYFRIKHVTSELQQMSIGSATKFLTKKILDAYRIPLPPADAQEYQSEILWGIQNKIDLNADLNQTLEQMAQAIFKSWFIDFEPVKAKIAALEAGGSEEDALLAAMQAISGKGEAELTRLQAEQPEQYAELRATAELFPSAMQDSELGEIPEGWRQRQVGELATIKGGKQRSRDLISNIGQVPVFGGAGIMGYTDEHNADGFVISVGRVGAYCGQFFSHRGPSWINNNASLIRPSNINHGEWLFIALQNIDLAPIKKGAAQPFVSNSDLAKLHVVWPGDMVIEKLTQQLRNLSLLQETLLQQSDSLSTFRDTLLPELLAGRLDTSGIGS